MLRNIVIAFSILVFILLNLISGTLFFLIRDQLSSAEIAEIEIIAIFSRIGSFVLVLILVLTVVAVLCGLIFVESFRKELEELKEKITGLVSAAFGSRLSKITQNELGEVAEAVNQAVDRREREIAKYSIMAEEKDKYVVEEKRLLVDTNKRIYEEQAKLEYVLARIKDGIVLLNKSKHIVLLNKAAEELTGYKQNEAVGKSIDSVVKFFDETREIMPDEYVSENKMGISKDSAYSKKRARIETSQSTPKLVDLVCVRLMLIQTQDLGYMIVMHDLTARLEIEKQKTDLLSSFAHELKQPLQMISNNAGSKQLQGGITNLSLTVDNLLTAGEIENGTIVINLEQVDLVQVVRDTIINAEALALERKIALQFNAPDFSTTVTGDQKRISQIVLNLLLNAIYFTLPGGSVTITLSQSEKEIITQIQDTGIGIKSETIKDLFSKFFVAENSKGLETGLGLGLYVCKRLVDLQNGKIWIDSVEGKGTVVSVSLPKAT